jgi:hypothetical protein
LIYPARQFIAAEEITRINEGEAQIEKGDYMTLQDYKNQRGL